MENACVGSKNNPCLGFHVFPVPASSLRLQAVAGDLQFISVVPAFQPVTVRVTDTSTPPDPVFGVSVLFQSLLGRTTNNAPIVSGGDTTITRDPMPIILGMSQAFVTSDATALPASSHPLEDFWVPWRFWAHSPRSRLDLRLCHFSCNRCGR